jgi:hypothetical protein
MKNKFLKYLFLSSSLMLLFSACRKDSFKGTEAGNSGKTFVWITEAPSSAQFFAPFTDVKAVNMFSVRRDAANNADLKKAVTVTLTAIPAYVDTLNQKNGTNFTAMPSDIYTVTSGGGVSASATGFTLNFTSGDFAKNITFNIDGNKVDLSKQYAVAYVISDAGGLAKKAGLDTIFSTVAIKNPYDGVYNVSGALQRDGDLVLGGTYVAGVTYSLATQSANSLTFNLLWADGATGVGGVNPIILTVDPTTNLVTVTSGVNATMKNIPGSDNSYDPATKTFHLSFVWNGTDPAHRSDTMTLTYKGSR